MKTRSRPRHPQIHLPPLDAGYALTLVDILERSITAIWRAHGDAMAELLTLRAHSHPRPSEYVEDGNPDASDDVLF